MGTKFPQPPLLNMLLTDYQLNGTAESLEAVGKALEAIALGGVHDHLGGGVHRYGTEPSWSVPHFEKMLYDNAQILSLYAAYHAISRQPLARDMTADIAGYLTPAAALRCAAAAVSARSSHSSGSSRP